MVVIERIVWDDWNIKHISRHGITQSEVEKVCQRDPLVSKTYSGRFRLIGPIGSKRTITVILAPKGKNSFYVVTARSASRKERRRYNEKKGGESND